MNILEPNLSWLLLPLLHHTMSQNGISVIDLYWPQKVNYRMFDAWDTLPCTIIRGTAASSATKSRTTMLAISCLGQIQNSGETDGKRLIDVNLLHALYHWLVVWSKHINRTIAQCTIANGAIENANDKIDENTAVVGFGCIDRRKASAFTSADRYRATPIYDWRTIN